MNLPHEISIRLGFEEDSNVFDMFLVYQVYPFS